jgi:hypothetical protein
MARYKIYLTQLIEKTFDVYNQYPGILYCKYYHVFPESDMVVINSLNLYIII